MTDAPPPDPPLRLRRRRRPHRGRRPAGGPQAPQAVHPHRPGHRPPDHPAHRADHQHRHELEHDQRAPRGRAGAVVHRRQRRPDRLVPGVGPGRRRGERHPGRPALLRGLVPELPPGAPAAGRRGAQQDQAGGALSQVRVIGVDSDDKTSSAKSFIQAAGRDVPGGLRPRRRHHQRPLLLRRRPLRGVRQRGRHDRQDRARAPC